VTQGKVDGRKVRVRWENRLDNDEVKGVEDCTPCDYRTGCARPAASYEPDSARRTQCGAPPALRGHRGEVRGSPSGRGRCEAHRAEIPDAETASASGGGLLLGGMRAGRDHPLRLVISLGGGSGHDSRVRGRDLDARRPRCHVAHDAAGDGRRAVGGKTGVNTASGQNSSAPSTKNAAVLVDPRHLDTMPRSEIVRRQARVIKRGSSPTRRSDLVETDPTAAPTRQATASEWGGGAIRVKAEVVASDLRESHLREDPKNGHPLGHAMSAASSTGGVTLRCERRGWCSPPRSPRCAVPQERATDDGTAACCPR